MKLPIKSTKRNPRRSNPVRQSMAVSRPVIRGDGLPNRLRTTLTYSEQISLNPGISTPANYYFRANDVYDPNFTSTGHQPKGFDQFSQFYNHFIVEKARLKAYVMQPTATTTGLQIAAVGLFAGSGDLSTLYSNSAGSPAANLLESKQTNKIDWLFAGSTSLSPLWKPLKCTFNHRDWFGKVADPSDADFQGSASASPTEIVFFGVTMASWDNTVDTDAVIVLVDIEYDVVWAEPKVLPNS